MESISGSPVQETAERRLLLNVCFGWKADIAHVARREHTQGMMRRRSRALYVLVGSVIAVGVMFVVPLAYGLLIWTRWIGD